MPNILIIAGAVIIAVFCRHPRHRRVVPAQRRGGHDSTRELARRRHGDLSRTRQAQGDPAAHHRHDDLEQGDQRRPRHHRSDGRSRRERHAAADQGARARERDRLGGRHGRPHQDGRQSLLRQARCGSDQHAHRSALELRASRDQSPHARPALLGQVRAARAHRGLIVIERDRRGAAARGHGAG